MSEMSRPLSSLARRIRLMAGRAVVSLIDDATKLQGVQVQLLEGEVRDEVERFQQYGLTSVPLAGAEGVYLSLNGSRDHGVVISVDDRRYRLAGLAGGEVAIYDDQGQKVHLKRSGMVIDGAGLPVTIENTPKVRMVTPLLEVVGEIRDRCDSTGRTMSGMRSIYDGHTHHENDAHGETNSPTQVMA